MKRFRPAIPDRVKLLVVIRQIGRCGCGCDEKLGTLANTEFDHCPPLRLREYDDQTRTYTPEANDPEKIVAKIKQHHRDKTNHPRGPHTSVGGDQHMIAKARPDRAGKFLVDKKPLVVPAIVDAGEKCRGCGNYLDGCTCLPKPERKSAFGSRPFNSAKKPEKRNVQPQ